MATPRKRRRNEAENAQEEEEAPAAPMSDTVPPVPSGSTSENRNDEYLVVLAKHKGQIFKVKT